MKKITLLLFAVIAFAFSFQTHAQCNYTLEMNDSYGDGWNGNTMDVLVNGTAVLSGVTLSGGAQGTMTFTVNDGDDVTTNWIGLGSYAFETSYRILDFSGTEVGTGAQTSITTGTITASCPTCTPTVVDSSTVVDDCGNSQFSVDVVVSTVGDGTSITDGLGGSFPVVAGTVTAGPYTNGDTVTLTVEHSDPACNFSLGDFETGCTPPGEVCENSIIIGALPYSTTDNTSNYGDDYGSADEPCSTSSYLRGDDVVYSFTPATDMSVNMTTSGTGSWTGLFVYEQCPFVTCVDSDTQSGGNPSIPEVSLIGGTTYYIVISTYPSPQSTAYTLDITENTCAASTSTVTVVNDCDVSGGFYIDVNVTDMGSATALTVSDDQGNPSQPLTAIGTLQFGPYVNGTDVVITIDDDNNDDSCTVTSSAITQTVCPPANDECADAIDLTVNADLACTVVTSGTTVAATASPQPDDATGTPDNDVWFTFTATNNSHQISLTNVTAVVGTSTDMGMSVFDDAAGCNMTATNEVGESDPNTLMLTGLTVGNSYYVRVYGWSSVNSAQTTFDICVGTPLSPPANDECSGALPITASTDSTCDNAVSGTTQSATASASGCTGGKDVWYSFTAPTDGDYIINVVETFESGSASTYTSAYEGACGALTQIGNSTSCSNTEALTISTVSGNVYYISVRSSSATNYVDFDLCIYPAPPVPANDACVDAFVITDFNNGDSQDATSATNNDGFIAVTGCGSANDGVWYTFQVTDAGTINIDVTNVVGWDAEITVLSGDCSAFTCVDNADSGGNGGSEGVSFTATANTQYWVNVGYYSGFTDSSEGPFTIDISTTDTATLGVPLSIEEFDNSSLFSYYPNPVENTLTLKGVKNIQNVTVLNMLGQEVLRVAPNAVNSQVDMSNLQSGAYFVKVTIENATNTIKIIKE